MKSKYNVGTPLYMPLESLLDNVYSPKSDIFSVGIIFYELLSGTTPWECRQEKELVQKLQTIPYKFP
jgi:serine/threonine protein kinase